MSSKYPEELDALATNSSNTTKAKDVHPALHNDANAAVNAVQETLGVEPQGGSADVAARLTVIESELGGLPEVEDWHVIGDPGEPEFFTGKENEDGTGADIPAWDNPPSSEYLFEDIPPVGFYKDALGIVHLQGSPAFKRTFWEDPPSEGEEHAPETRVFTLPPGYRPAAKVTFISGCVWGRSYDVQIVPFSVTAAGVVGSWGAFINGPDNLNESTIFGPGFVDTLFPLDMISFRAAP